MTTPRYAPVYVQQLAGGYIVYSGGEHRPVARGRWLSDSDYDSPRMDIDIWGTPLARRLLKLPEPL